MREWMPVGLSDSAIANEVHFVGYLRQLGARPVPVVPGDDYYSIECQVGGGADGREIVESVIRAAQLVRSMVSRPVYLHVSCGPLMPARDVSGLLLHTDEFTSMRRWRSGVGLSSSLVISMAGYNSCVELAWSRSASVLIPRSDEDDLEQSIRADLFTKWFRHMTVVGMDGAEGFAEVIAKALDWERVSLPRAERDEPEDFFAAPRQVAFDVLGECFEVSGNLN